MAKISNIPDTDSILRFAKKRHLSWELDEAGNPIEIKSCYHDLFKLRTDEEFIKKHGAPEKALSVNWVDFFTGDHEQRIAKAIADFLGTARTVNKKEAFAKLNVGEVKKICENHSAKIRIVHDAKTTSTIKSHSSITQLPQENSLLFDELCEIALKGIIKV